MTKIWDKYINKHPLKSELKEVLKDIENNNLSNYQIKQLSGYNNYFRIRKGKIRIIFIKKETGNEVKAVDTRGSIYKKL